jgi:hypothetical protein
VAGDDRQDRLEPLVLAGDRVDQCLAVVRLEARFQRLDDGRVDHQRQVRLVLDQADSAAHQVDLVRQGVAHVDVQHGGAARDLFAHVDRDLGQVALLQLGLEALAAGRVDPLADDAERLVRADGDDP